MGAGSLLSAGLCAQQQQGHVAVDRHVLAVQNLEASGSQVKAKLLFVKSKPAVAVADAHGFIGMALKVAHKQSAAHGHDAAYFAQAFCRVRKVVQHKVDTGKVCLVVAQGQVAQLANAQRNTASGQIFGSQAAAAYFEHAGRAVHANEAAHLGQHAGQNRPRSATKVHCGSAALGYGIANSLRKIK